MFSIPFDFLVIFQRFQISSQVNVQILPDKANKLYFSLRKVLFINTEF